MSAFNVNLRPSRRPRPTPGNNCRPRKRPSRKSSRPWSKTSKGGPPPASRSHAEAYGGLEARHAEQAAQLCALGQDSEGLGCVKAQVAELLSRLGQVGRLEDMVGPAQIQQLKSLDPVFHLILI